MWSCRCEAADVKLPMWSCRCGAADVELQMWSCRCEAADVELVRLQLILRASSRNMT